MSTEELDDLKRAALEMGCPDFEGNIVDGVCAWMDQIVRENTVLKREWDRNTADLGRLRADLSELRRAALEVIESNASRFRGIAKIIYNEPLDRLRSLLKIEGIK